MTAERAAGQAAIAELQRHETDALPPVGRRGPMMGQMISVGIDERQVLLQPGLHVVAMAGSSCRRTR